MAKVPLKAVLKECKRRGIRFGMEQIQIDDFGDAVLSLIEAFENRGVLGKYMSALHSLKKWPLKLPREVDEIERQIKQLYITIERLQRNWPY